jgi:hypothetical protein|tara:strand:+ start:409 stop:573 length:165 start_codon:yes stop_codon:yes gene_type:complete
MIRWKKKMRNILTAGMVALVLSVVVVLAAIADEKKHEMKMDHKKVPCTVPVHLT